LSQQQNIGGTVKQDIGGIPIFHNLNRDMFLGETIIIKYLHASKANTKFSKFPFHFTLSNEKA